MPVELVTYTAAGKFVESIEAGEWDIAFFVSDPIRASDAECTAAYEVIEGAYMVQRDSPIRRNEDVDREGTRVVVGKVFQDCGCSTGVLWRLTKRWRCQRGDL